MRQASLRLPERQRVALELCEGEGLPYGRIAERLGTGDGAVAQLLERARINLYDELRGTALASVAAPSAECERALPLIAARQDGELAPSSEDASWLDSHLSGCNRCRLAAEQMGDAAAIYRGEAPASALTPAAGAGAGAASRADVAPTAGGQTGAAAGPGAGAEQVAAAGRAPGDTASVAAAALPRSGGRPRIRRPDGRRIVLAGGVAALALAGVAIALVAHHGSPNAAPPPAADAAARGNAAAEISRAHVVRVAHKARSARHKRKRAKSGAGAAGAATIQAGGSATTPLYTSTQASGGGSGGAPASGHHTAGGDAAVHPARQKSTAKPAAEPKPPSSSTQPSQSTAQPASEPAPPPVEEAPPPAEEPAPEHGHKGDPPGKPADRPPHK